MNIIIVGAGNVGLHIASILSKDKHNIFLIDRNEKRLAEASLELDIATRLASGTDWQLLEDLREADPDGFLALTDSDETNLVSCAIAKQLGYPRTIARLSNPLYLNRTRLDFARMFGVDQFVAPEVLVANDILKYILLPGSIVIESFAHGAVQLRTILIPDNWRGGQTPLSKLKLPEEIMVGLIRRVHLGQSHTKASTYKIIIPHGEDSILPGDEVTFVGETKVIEEIPRFFGIEQRKIQSVVIVGGSGTGSQLASLLFERNISTRLIERDFDVACRLARELPDCGILHHDATDIEYLESEKIGKSDLFVACTEDDESNILTAMLAKEVGCKDVIAMLSSPSYISLTNKLGLSHVVSPRVSAANRILSLILSKQVTSVVSLYENQVEIVEIQVSLHSRLVGIPLSELGPMLPKDFLLAMIQNRGRIMIANGSRIISPGDTVIAISTPRNVRELEKVF